MKATITVTIEGRQHVAPIWNIEKVKWTGSKMKCPRCRRNIPATALIDVVQYGMIDRDLCTTIFDCPRCGKSFAVEYTIDWQELDEMEAKHGQHDN